MKELSGFKVRDTDQYNHAIKKLKKRFPHIESDCKEFIDSIKTTDDLGVHLGNNTYKVRIANSDKNSGKSGGYRLISYLKIINNEIYLLFVYDKSDYENIKESDIDAIIASSVDNF